jgi:hypothetical protein
MKRTGRLPKNGKTFGPVKFRASKWNQNKYAESVAARVIKSGNAFVSISMILFLTKDIIVMKCVLLEILLYGLCECVLLFEEL